MTAAPPVVRRVRVQNFKSIKACDVALGPLAILVGPNGSGKSNFLDALRFTSDALSTTLDLALRDRGGINEVRRRSGGHPNHFAVRLDLNVRSGTVAHYAFKVGAAAGGGFRVTDEECAIRPAEMANADASFRVRNGELVTTTLEERLPAVSPDRLFLVSASNVAAFRSVYDALTFMAANISDGSLRGLGVLVALLQGNGTPPTLVGIEEPEVALHPAAVSVLIDAIRDASQHTQVIVTSHSLELLDRRDAAGPRHADLRPGLRNRRVLPSRVRPALDHIVRVHPSVDPDQRRHLRSGLFTGWEIVDNTARLCAMNLLLHGIESPESDSPVHVDDALRADPGDRFDMVLTNPPLTSCSTSRRCSRSEAPLQSSSPTTCCFEGGAGETIRRRLLRECDVHTLLRLPTGIFYAQGVKANVLFFDRKPGSATPWTEDLWVYDLRTNKHFTLKARPLGRADLDDFVECYHAGNRAGRQDSDRFRRFAYDELVARDKASLDIFWLRDETLEDTDNLPSPGVIAAEIVEDLKAALVEFTQLAESLGNVGLDTDTGEPSSS